MADTATVRVERRIAAPPEAVFDAWLNPEHAGRWLFRTEGGVLERCEIDARVGGRLRIDERRGEELAQHYGEYVEIERPHRLAFDFWTDDAEERTRIRIEIGPDGDGARLTLTHEGVWTDWEAQTRQGWTMIVDNLARALS